MNDMLKGVPYNVNKDNLRRQYLATNDNGYLTYGDKSSYLKPCPFCGCRKVEVMIEDKPNSIPGLPPAMVCTVRCHRGFISFTDSCHGETWAGEVLINDAEYVLEKALRCWNRRDKPEEDPAHKYFGRFQK